MRILSTLPVSLKKRDEKNEDETTRQIWAGGAGDLPQAHTIPSLFPFPTHLRFLVSMHGQGTDSSGEGDHPAGDPRSVESTPSDLEDRQPFRPERQPDSPY